MKSMSAKTKKEVLKDLEIYFGSPLTIVIMSGITSPLVFLKNRL